MVETKDKERVWCSCVHPIDTGVQMLHPYVNFQVLTARVAQMTECYYTMYVRKAIVYTYSIHKCIVWCSVLF